MTKNITNSEQLEAQQADINAKTESFIQQLPPEESKKFTAISEALDILTKNNVPTLMFVELPNIHSYFKTLSGNPLKYTGCQYNNLAEFVNKDKNKNIVTEDGDRFNNFVTHSIVAFQFWLSHIFVIKSTQDLINIFYYHECKRYDWLKKFNK